MSIAMGHSLYYQSATIIEWINEANLPPGEDSSFGSPVLDEPIILFKSGARLSVFSSKEEPVGRYDGSYEKQPVESVTITHDFAPDLDDDVIIAAPPTVTAIKISDGSDATTDIITDIIQVDPDNDRRIKYGLTGGVDGEDYAVTVTATTDSVVGSLTPGKRQVEHFISVRKR